MVENLKAKSIIINTEEPQTGSKTRGDKDIKIWENLRIKKII